jgi:hypothetical protein
MAQQHMDFEQNVNPNTKTYSTGYEESPSDNEYSYRAAGQKIPQQESLNFTAFQRFALAVLSLCLFAGLCVVFVILALVMPAASAETFAPVFASMGFFFVILLIFINVIVNRKR